MIGNRYYDSYWNGVDFTVEIYEVISVTKNDFDKKIIDSAKCGTAAEIATWLAARQQVPHMENSYEDHYNLYPD